jgi:hypothetical protein
MFKLVKKQKRTSTDVPFFFEANPQSKKYIQYIVSKYINTGLLESSEWVISEDGLEATLVTKWKTPDDFLQFVSDEVCIENQIQPGQVYDAANEIASDLITDNIDK